MRTFVRRVAQLGVVAALALVAVALINHAGTVPTRPIAPAGVPPTSSPASPAGPATVVDTMYERDPNNPSTGTHYADCRASDGAEWRVVISASQDYGGLTKGDRCPDGPHLLTPRQENPGLYDEISSALNSPMPYSGGNADGPCGAWSAADPTDAAQMSTAYQQCMAQHGAGH